MLYIGTDILPYFTMRCHECDHNRNFKKKYGPALLILPIIHQSEYCDHRGLPRWSHMIVVHHVRYKFRTLRWFRCFGPDLVHFWGSGAYFGPEPAHIWGPRAYFGLYLAHFWGFPSLFWPLFGPILGVRIIWPYLAHFGVYGAGFGLDLAHFRRSGLVIIHFRSLEPILGLIWPIFGSPVLTLGPMLEV